MEKIASTDHPVLEILRKRWSPRAFSNRTIEKADILSLFEAARWAPSCFNDQPWQFIIAKQDDEESFHRMLDCLVEKNQVWAKNSYLLVLAVARITFRTRGSVNRHSLHDMGLAIQNLMLQATSLGLYTHAMAGFSVEKARETYEIPDDFQPITAIAVGYPGDPECLSPELIKMEFAERERYPIGDFLYEKKWGKSFLS